MNSGLSTHFEKWRWDAIDIGFTSSSIAQSGWCRATSLLCPSSCRDFLRLCNSCRLHNAIKFSQYWCLRSPSIVNRGFCTAACFVACESEKLNVDKVGGHPREVRRPLWSAIAWGRRMANARSTLWSTAEIRRAHCGRVFVMEARTSSASLSALMARRRVSCRD